MNDIPINVPPLTPPPEKPIWGGWATAVLGAVVIIVFLLLLVFVVIAAMIGVVIIKHVPLTLDDITNVFNSYMGLLISISGIIAYLGGMALLIAFIKARGSSIAGYLGLKRTGWKAPLIMVGVTAAYLAATSLVTGFFHVGEGDTRTLVNIYHTSVWPVLLWIAVVVLAPIFEESMFRGFLFEGLRRSRVGLGGALLVTSATWTALHYGYSQYSLVAIFIFGLVLGMVRYRTGSLWNTMLMHALYNAIGMAMLALNIGV